MGMIWAFTLGGVAAALAALRKLARPACVGSLGALALGFALWFSWSHWVDLSHHWTQRDLFWRYYDRRAPGRADRRVHDELERRDLLLAQHGEADQGQPGPHGRRTPICPAGSGRWSSTTALGMLVRPSGRITRITQVDRDLNNKFVLVTID